MQIPLHFFAAVDAHAMKSVQGMQEVAVDIGMAGKLGHSCQYFLLVVCRPGEHAAVDGVYLLYDHNFILFCVDCTVVIG